MATPRTTLAQPRCLISVPQRVWRRHACPPPSRHFFPSAAAATAPCGQESSGRLALFDDAEEDRCLADTALLQRVAEGDSTAFAGLYERMAGTMFSLVVRILNSRAEAEDVLQIGFQRVWQRAADYDASRGSPFAWIATIMRHKAIDALRVRSGHVQRIDAAFQQRNEAPETKVGSDRLAVSEQCTAVRTALARLGVQERRSIELAFFDGLSHVEIARALGEPVGTVKARIRRGMLKLRPSLICFENAA